MKTEEIVRVLTFAAGNSDDCVFRECVTTAISRLQAADKPCERCTEWMRAYDNILASLNEAFQLQLAVSPERLWRGMKSLDPRRKPEPAKEFSSKDWLWG